MIRITIIVKMTTDYTETKYITAKYLLNIEYFIGQQGSQLPPWTGAMKHGFMFYFSDVHPGINPCSQDKLI